MSTHDLASAGLAAFLETLRPLVAEEVDRAVRERLAAIGTGPEPVWLTCAEAARREGVAPATVRAWRDAGHLGEPGRNGRVNAEALRRFMATRTKIPTRPPRVETERPVEGRAKLQIAAALQVAGDRR